MAGFNLIPAVMFFCGLLGVFRSSSAHSRRRTFCSVPCSVRSSASRQVRHRVHLELYRFGCCGRHDS